MTIKTKPLLLSRRFVPMFMTQFFGAFNDNIYKYALLMVFTYGWLDRGEMSISLLNNLAALLFILPFFIFSATAGQLADRYERSKLIRTLKMGEIGIMFLACIGFMIGNMWLLLLALFLMGTQSAFFGPIKYAVLPDILKPNELMTGNAIFQSGTSIAILLGMVIGGIMISMAAGNMTVICVVLMIIAVMGYLSSRLILPQQVADANCGVNWNFAVTSGEIIKFTYGLPVVFVILLGNSWYWFYGATIITQIPEMTQQYLHGNENVSSLILTFFSVGVVIGSAICRKLSGDSVNIKMVPVGAIGLTVFALYLGWALSALPVYQGDYFNIVEIFSQGIEVYHVLAAVTLLGITGGFYIVPLYAMMQAKSPESHRARIVAANNILNAVFMVSAAIFCIIILSLLKLSLAQLFMITACLSGVVTYLIIARLRGHLATSNEGA